MVESDKIQRSSGLEKLQELRSRIADNTESIIGLFHQRAELAREIGELKRELGLPPRIREREEHVLNSLGEMDPVSKAIITSLFEFSIVNETKQEKGREDVSAEPHKINVTGPRKNLELLAGLLISRPGTEVYSASRLPIALEKGIQINGGHIVSGDHSEPDLTICLERDGSDCDILISAENKMLMRLQFPLTPVERIVKVRQ